MITLVGEYAYHIGNTFGHPFVWNWIFYFAFGIYIAEGDRIDIVLEKSIVIFTIGFIIVMLTAFYGFIYSSKEIELFTSTMRPAVMLYVIGTLGIGLNYFSEPNRLLQMVDSNSLIIYYVHPFILMVIVKAESIFNIETNNVIFMLLNIVLVFIGAVIFSLLYRTTKNFIKRIYENNTSRV